MPLQRDRVGFYEELFILGMFSGKRMGSKSTVVACWHRWRCCGLRTVESGTVGMMYQCILATRIAGVMLPNTFSDDTGLQESMLHKGALKAWFSAIRCRRGDESVYFHALHPFP